MAGRTGWTAVAVGLLWLGGWGCDSEPAAAMPTPPMSAAAGVAAPGPVPPIDAAGAAAEPPAGATPSAQAGAGPASETEAPPSTMAGSAGQQPASAGAAGTPADPQYDYVDEEVELSATLTVPAGATWRVGPGTRFTASSGAKLHIGGTLIVEGSPEAPVEFLGAGVPRSWNGIVVDSGGTLRMSHVRISGATYGIRAERGSSYAVDHAEIGQSFKVAVLFSDGTFSHTKFHASGDNTFSPVNEVSVDDVNGTLTIIDASPTITDSSFDNSSPLVDMIRIGGNSSPLFDRVSVEGAHCGFHTNGGVNTTPTIKNSVLRGMSYGVMAYTAKPTFENCNFIDNSADVGFCFGATAENAPTLTNNYYSAGAAVFDPSCFEIGAPDASPAASAHAGAGPAGL